jgi:hypothetical protein
MNLEHISNYLDSELDLKKIFKLYSNSLFELTKDQKIVLSLIAKHGPSTEYQLGKLGFNRGLNRDSVVRILRGRESSKNSLIENNYVVLTNTKQFRNTGKIRRVYGLSLKGMLSVLGHVNFEDFYLVKNYFNYLYNGYNDQTLSLLSILLVKYNLLLILSWHYSKGIELSKLHNTKNYFLDWILSNELMKIDSTYSSIIDSKDNLLSYRDSFFAILSVISKLIKELGKNFEADWSELDVTDKNSIPNHLWKNIQQWPFLLEHLQLKDMKSFTKSSKQMHYSINQQNLSNKQKQILSQFKLSPKLFDDNPKFPSKFII